jgi:hypothetical protein
VRLGDQVKGFGGRALVVTGAVPGRVESCWALSRPPASLP